MLYLIGLGLSQDSLSRKGLRIARKCKKIYLENYTVEFPYSIDAIKEVIGKKIHLADRDFVESLEIIDEAVRTDIALLIYGSPLTATTHITLLEEAKKSRVKVKVIYNASVIDAVGATGLQLYKFGKIASMPKWQPEKKFTPDSFMEIVKHNMSMKAHSLILIDIGLRFRDSMKQLEEAAKNNSINLKEIVVCQALGTKRQRILYSNIETLKKMRDIICPFCIIIPSKLHFMEKEFLNNFSK